MKLALLGLASTLLLFNSAHAAEFAAAIGHKGYGRCHMDYCSFFVIDAAVPIGSGNDGTLYAVAQHQWGAEYNPNSSIDEYSSNPIRVEKATPYLSMVYCSKSRPMVLDYEGGKWQALLLHLQSVPGGAYESTFQFYYAACHNVIVRDPNPKGLAQRLGYPKEAANSLDVEDLSISPKEVLEGDANRGSSTASDASAKDMDTCSKIQKPLDRLTCFDVLAGHSE